jgi:hypothetical protein
MEAWEPAASSSPKAKKKKKKKKATRRGKGKQAAAAAQGGKGKQAAAAAPRALTDAERLAILEEVAEQAAEIASTWRSRSTDMREAVRGGVWAPSNQVREELRIWAARLRIRIPK